MFHLLKSFNGCQSLSKYLHFEGLTCKFVYSVNHQRRFIYKNTLNLETFWRREDFWWEIWFSETMWRDFEAILDSENPSKTPSNLLIKESSTFIHYWLNPFNLIRIYLRKETFFSNSNIPHEDINGKYHQSILSERVKQV